MTKIAIFLDRDGTINEEVNFLNHPEQINLIEGSAEAIREANKLGLKVIVFTNQSGIARGFIDEDMLGKIHKRLSEMLAQFNAIIDAYYYCPHHPTEGKDEYRVECECRKPRDGMLRRAAREQNVDLKKSFVVGDRCIDIQAGKLAGATTILVLTGYGKDELKRCLDENVKPDFVVPNLKKAIEVVKRCLSEKITSG
jgi:D-glycero-D-manno-heptose 1,7-bisphosphate phosphatase